ncbi:no distributive disjunction [Leptinotarsa decemlineata]|uniref:no distributive disjunction n=1 Tax=Leptinotarsa decemlineata TaxID=7539 RepID=UPI003D3080DF
MNDLNHLKNGSLFLFYFSTKIIIKMDSDLEFVNVSIRIKPVLDKDDITSCLKIISKQPPVLFMIDRSQTYNFDNIFTEEVSQETVYNETVKPLVDYVKQGYNCTVFAYGQTGTGKTYTIGTNSNVLNETDFGLIPRTLNQFFEYNNDSDSEVEISLSFIEIYNEKVFDLLQNDNKPPLQVKGLKAQGFCQEKVFNLFEARHFLKMGNKNRHTAGTKQNAQSSRSHAIFTIYCKVRHKDSETLAKLNLVDLAGCENVRKTGTEGDAFHEGVNINKGLLSIGQVMTALSMNSSYIPYRQSIITSILQDSLNRQNFISLIACISPLTEDSTETLQTLDFAQRVKKMKNKPEVNEIVTRYKKENPTLFVTSRTSSTPFKRPALPNQTPRPTKKLKRLPLTVIDEPDHSPSLKSFCSNNSNSVSSISSTASALSNLDPAQSNLSPVIKKYMTAMESSLMGKLELVIKSTLKRPGRESYLTEDASKQDIKENINCTPMMPWNEIQSEVSKIVRSEIAQLTSRSTRAASSPIDVKENLDNIKKVLNYGSPLEDSIGTNYKSNTEENVQFKIPERPVEKRTKVKPQRTPSISPIETVKIRRSIRLSMKKCNNNNSQQFNLSDVNYCLEGFENLEMSMKSNFKDDSLEDFYHGKRRSIRLKHQSKLKESNGTLKNSDSITKKKHFKKPTISNTPIGKRLLKENRNDSPCTAHTKIVLDTLNTGSLKQLEKLHSIGVKTAQQIVLFREIKGRLKKISDLSGMPGWGSKKFEKFVEQNFLKKELI